MRENSKQVSELFILINLMFVIQKKIMCRLLLQFEQAGYTVYVSLKICGSIHRQLTKTEIVYPELTVTLQFL